MKKKEPGQEQNIMLQARTTATSRPIAASKIRITLYRFKQNKELELPLQARHSMMEALEACIQRPGDSSTKSFQENSIFPMSWQISYVAWVCLR